MVPTGAQTVMNRFATPPAGIPETYLTGADFLSFLSKLPNVLGANRHVLYSYKAYAAAGQTKLSFFDQNIGSATNNEGDTNMQQASQLAGQELFVCLFVGVSALPAQADYDAAAAGTAVAFGQWTELMVRNCWLNFQIGRKKYLDTVGPLAIFSPGWGPVPVAIGAATVIRNTVWPQFGTPDTKAKWVQDPPITLVAGENIVCDANWKAVLAVTTAAKLGVLLDGYLIAPAQV